MSTSLLRLRSEAIDETITTPAEHSTPYTTFLIENARWFSDSYPPDSDNPSSQALVSKPTMSCAQIPTWDVHKISYERIPRYNSPDRFSDTEECSWEEGLQAIEDHDWSGTVMNDGDKSSKNDM